jgi:hypothetical protein
MEMGVFVTNKSKLMYIYTEKNSEALPDEKKLIDASCFPAGIDRNIPWDRNITTLNGRGYDNEVKLFSHL